MIFLKFGVWGLGSRVQDLERESLGIRVYGVCGVDRVQGLGLRVDNPMGFGIWG
jgi:hypothetical protein